MITLYRKNVGGIGTWRIWSVDQTIHIAHATVMGGSEVTHTEFVPQGLGGRSIYEQIKLFRNFNAAACPLYQIKLVDFRNLHRHSLIHRDINSVLAVILRIKRMSHQIRDRPEHIVFVFDHASSTAA